MMLDERPSEQWVIEAIQNRLGLLASKRDGLSVRIAVAMDDLDDCALLDVHRPARLVVGSDYIRGRQFDLFRAGLLTYFDLGYYLIGANLSDIAAMGGVPVGATIILRYPPDVTKRNLLELIDGIASCCEIHGPCPVLGGDTGGAADLVLAATMIAAVEGTPLLRSSASAGDRVYVVGYPGRAAAAQRILLENNTSVRGTLTDDIECLLWQWRRPVPLLLQGQRLAESGLRVACQDTSDGLRTTIQQLARRSRVDIIITESSIRVDPVLERVARVCGCSTLELYMGASVDFGLVFTLPCDVDANAVLRCDSKLPLQELGYVTQGKGNAYLQAKDGTLRNLPGEEYHQ
jgi:thiamine-monophosphate kinase